MEYILMIIGAVLVNNIILAQFLGICPFLGVSGKVNTALGMGAAVLFVMTLATGFNKFCDDKKTLRVGKDEIVRFNEFYEDLKQTLEAYRGANGSLSVLKELWHYFACFFQLTEEQLHSLLVIREPEKFDEAVREIFFLRKN